MAKEYIEREAITKLAKEIKDNFAPLHRAVIDAFVYGIKTNIPSADVVEVVWCCNCIHLKVDSIDRTPYCDIHSTKLDKFYVRTDDYCSYGEKR